MIIRSVSESLQHCTIYLCSQFPLADGTWFRILSPLQLVLTLQQIRHSSLILLVLLLIYHTTCKVNIACFTSIFKQVSHICSSMFYTCSTWGFFIWFFHTDGFHLVTNRCFIGDSTCKEPKVWTTDRVLTQCLYFIVTGALQVIQLAKSQSFGPLTVY